jgi:hypothetical protein
MLCEKAEHVAETGVVDRYLSSVYKNTETAPEVLTTGKVEIRMPQDYISL